MEKTYKWTKYINVSRLPTAESHSIDERRTTKRQRTRAKLLANAIALFREQGVRETKLAEVAADLDADRGVRCVLLRGQGRAFCAGGDLASIHEAVQKEGTSGGALKLKEMMGHLHMAILTLTLIGMR